MSIRVKKLIGTLITVVFLTIYCLLVMSLAVRVLPESNGWVQLIFYVVTGMIWVVPVAGLIKWMHTPPRTDEPS
ncbi:MAG: DUF2842 domain-containing protein [Pseudomonadota bacterium]